MERKEKTNQAESVATESVIDLPVPREQADQARGGSEPIPLAGQTIRLRIATTNNQGK